MIAGRSAEADRVVSWLQEATASRLTLSADSRQEALAFFAAVLYSLPDVERLPFLARILITKSEAAWHYFTAISTNLIIIPLLDFQFTPAQATKAGNRLLVVHGQECYRVIELLT